MSTRRSVVWYATGEGSAVVVSCSLVIGCECQELCAHSHRFNLLKPNVNYSGRPARLTSKVVFYIFIQQI